MERKLRPMLTFARMGLPCINLSERNMVIELAVMTIKESVENQGWFDAIANIASIFIPFRLGVNPANSRRFIRVNINVDKTFSNATPIKYLGNSCQQFVSIKRIVASNIRRITS